LKDIAIYTACTRNKDVIADPLELTENADYFCYSDKPFLSTVRKYIPIPKNIIIEGQGWLGSILTARQIKSMPHKLEEIKDYKMWIWTDSNMQIVKDIQPFIEQMEGYDVGLFWHGYQKDIYEEADKLKQLSENNDKYSYDPNIGDLEKLDALINEYKKSGLEINNLWATGILFIRQNNEKVRKANEDWWMQLQKYHRDQISLPYIIAKHELKVKTFTNISYFESPEFKEYFRYIRHRR
jgi:hypothetical protein